MSSLLVLAQGGSSQLGKDVVLVALVIGAIFVVGAIALLVKCYRKVEQGTTIVRNGFGGSRVSFSGIFVIPVLHRAERMDISVKRVEIARTAEDGLVCRDNMRADTKVAFFVRVNKTPQDVLNVAQSVGCARASNEGQLRELFDAKFSEALKTVGKKFDFVELYEERERFKDEILKVIGTDLNGYVLDDCAIDYLEQTPVEQLDPQNILDAEGIKKIADLTASQQILANHILREKEKTIKKQDVEAREAILQLERQQIEAEERQKREILSLTAREESESKKVQEEERLKGERARISAQEEIDIAEENRQRQVIVALKNKERTEAVETERVEKDRALEQTERERIVELARIEKEKALEVERKNIQDVIRERVTVERGVVEEQERIKDTEAFAAAKRHKEVAVTAAQEEAEQKLIVEVKAAEASRLAAEKDAERRVIEAEAALEAAQHEANAKKVLAEGVVAEQAASGLAEAQVVEARAAADQKQGTMEAEVHFLKADSEAKGIEQKAAAMEKLNAASQEHEEFRLRLALQRDLELAEIDARKEIAREQADVVGQALKSARIDIVGGETVFFDRIVNAVGQGKGVDRLVGNSDVLTRVNDTFFGGNADEFKRAITDFIDRFGVSTEDMKNLSIAALIAQLMLKADGDDEHRLSSLLGMAKSTGVAGRTLDSVFPGMIS